jgi:hypothetical protein
VFSMKVLSCSVICSKFHSFTYMYVVYVVSCMGIPCGCSRSTVLVILIHVYVIVETLLGSCDVQGGRWLF